MKLNFLPTEKENIRGLPDIEEGNERSKTA